MPIISASGEPNGAHAGKVDVTLSLSDTAVVKYEGTHSGVFSIHEQENQVRMVQMAPPLLTNYSRTNQAHQARSIIT